MNWKESAARVRWNLQPFIGGRYRPSAASETFDDINPANETVLTPVSVGHARDVDAAVATARQRFEDGAWSRLSPVRRAEVLRNWADLIAAHKEEIALLDTLEMGKPIKAALQDAGVSSPEVLRSCAGVADKLVGQTAPLIGNNLNFNVYEPRGVVGAITPWNFPSLNVSVKVAPALAAGNSVVLKPSELATGSALKLAELALEAGLPEGVLNVVPGLGATVGTALALHRDVDLLSFTGSTVTGRKIMELSGRSNGKPVLLECGGKSPQVVFADVASLDAVAEAAVQSIMRNQGQVCAAHTRLVVQEEIREALVAKIVERARPYKPADPLDESTNFGPLASPTQRKRVKGYIEQGLKDGAHAALQGTIQEQGGCYVAPWIFDRVDNQMSIVREEIFGPVLCVQPFKSEAEAIQLANGTEYGLVATAWTRDAGRTKRLAQALRAGVISIRTGGEEAPGPGTHLGFEPQKASGFGTELGIRGLEAYSTLKAVSLSGG